MFLIGAVIMVSAKGVFIASIGLTNLTNLLFFSQIYQLCILIMYVCILKLTFRLIFKKSQKYLNRAAKTLDYKIQQVYYVLVLVYYT